MDIKAGEKAKLFSLQSFTDKKFELNSIKGKRCLLSFYRFAACPFCNLRIHELVQRHDEFGENFIIIAIFDASLDNLSKQSNKHHAPFPILADENGLVYQQYCVRRSVLGMFKGMFGRLPLLLYAMLMKGYVPLQIKGNITTMPVDFLIDENGIINRTYFGQDAGDHLSLGKIKKFALA